MRIVSIPGICIENWKVSGCVRNVHWKSQGEHGAEQIEHIYS